MFNKDLLESIQKYIFSSTHSSISSDRVLEFIIIVILLLSIMFLILSFNKKIKIPVNRKLFRKIGANLLLNFFLALIVLFTRIEEIPYISLNLYFVLWLFISFLQIIRVLLYLLRKYRQDVKNFYKEETRKKYLPKKRKNFKV